MQAATQNDYYIQKLARDERIKRRQGWKREGRLMSTAAAAQAIAEVADHLKKLQVTVDEAIGDGLMESIDQRLTKLNAWSQSRRV